MAIEVGQTLSFFRMNIQAIPYADPLPIMFLKFIMSKKQAITRIGYRPGFAPKSIELGKKHQNPGRSTAACNSALWGSNPSSGTLFGPFFKFHISHHCTVYDTIMKNRQIRELARARGRAHLFMNGVWLVVSLSNAL